MFKLSSCLIRTFFLCFLTLSPINVLLAAVLMDVCCLYLVLHKDQPIIQSVNFGRDLDQNAFGSWVTVWLTGLSGPTKLLYIKNG